MTRPLIVHFMTSLSYGGTENFIKQIIVGLKDRYRFQCLYMKSEGAVAQELRSQGISVERFQGKFPPEASLIHTHMYRANVLGRWMAHWRGIPVISSQRSSDAWKKPYHVWLDRWTASWARGIIANCQATKNLLMAREKIPESKIFVLPNAVEKDYFSPGIPEKAKSSLGIPSQDIVVGTVGRFHREKGVHWLPPILNRVWEKDPNVQFLLVGDGSERPLLERLKQDHPDRLRLAGYRQNPLETYAAMDIFLLPSFEESFSQSTLEAMAQGLPCVVSRTGGMSELVNHDNGFLIEPGDIEGYARTILQLCHDPELRRRLGKKAREKAAGFTLPKMINALKFLYEKFLIH